MATKLPIRYRITLYVTLLAACVLCFLGLALYSLLKRDMLHSLDMTLSTTGYALSASLSDELSEEDFSYDEIHRRLPDIIRPFERQTGALRMAVYDGHDTPVFTLNGGDSLYIHRFEDTLQSHIIESGSYRTGYYSYTLSGTKGGTIILSASLANIDNQLRTFLELLSWLIPLALLLTAIGTMSITRRMLRDLDALSRRLAGIEPYRLLQPLDTGVDSNEVRNVVDSFNLLIGRIRQLLDMQRQFIADASHELKTPLTIVRNEVEMLLNRPSITIRESEILRVILEEVDISASLAVNLIHLVHLDDPEPLHLEPGQINNIIMDSIAQLQPLLHRNKLALRLDLDSSAPGLMDRDQIGLVLINIIENAVKYSPPGSSIQVTTYDADEKTFVSISDEGCGIEEDELARVFNRFYRTRSARKSTVPGSGLGLSVVKRIVDLHRGNIAIQSHPGQGTQLTISLPLDTVGGTRPHGQKTEPDV